MPLSVAYTFTESEFKNSFFSDFSQWGNVRAGDELPYLPASQLNVQLGLEGQNWQVSMAYKYVDEMSEAAGSSVDLEGATVEELSQIDIAGWYEMNEDLRIYAKLDNATDETQIVSRRPFGARPGKPRQFILGAKYQF
jgi:Fe(3+) dicitrate transport protein